MTLDLVVQRVGAALGRGHALFSPSPLEVGSSLSASGQSLENVGQRVGVRSHGCWGILIESGVTACLSH
ncbi:hypothetical protein [Mycobacteroides abscessus]|uniref:hypothetical protein n=1 Tax=Mycobacteroides abscessus TaxID=36809 RepID=UPI001041E5F7|nr:hypothetical protein [Mycobacteroides abscessus]